MNVELIKQFADIHQALKEEGVYGIIGNQLQVGSEVIKDFENLQVETRGSYDVYPYEVFAMVGEVKIFAIVTSEGIKDFPQLNKQLKEKLAADLRKQISYLEEDVILDGMEDEKHVS